MKLDRSSLRLYAVTDRSWTKEKSLKVQVEESILGGVTFVQLREKNINPMEYLKIAKEIKEVTDKYKIPFVVNDNIEVALSASADGVHIGQDDLSLKEVRQKMGSQYIIGVSVQTVEQAILAESEGADYLGVGTIFPTSTKLDASFVTIQTLQEICKAVDIPVIAIGGIQRQNLHTLAGSGIDGIAVVSAIFAETNRVAAAQELLKQVNDFLTK